MRQLRNFKTNRCPIGNRKTSASYDHMGRRRSKNAQRFFYDGYLQICNYHSPTPNFNCYIWDPTEPVATRPLMWQTDSGAYLYAHDGNKNVSEVLAENGDISAHYEYAPFGEVIAQHGELAESNPWRFSSEYTDDVLGMVYYNYRHYDPVMGRWLSRDPVFGDYSYIFAGNASLCGFDLFGLASIVIGRKIGNPEYPMEYKQSFYVKDIEKGCELNFIQLALTESGWDIDNKFGGTAPNGESFLKSLGPYYVDWSQEGVVGYKLSDGGRIFF